MKYSRWYHNGLLWSIFGAAQVAALVVGEHWAATRSAQPVNVVITAADAQEDEADETAGTPLKRFGSATDLQAEAQKQLQDSQASAATLLDLAKLARDFQLMPLADRLLTRTLERNPAQVDALFLRGRTQSDLGNNGEAERLYGEVLARAPSHQKAAYNMAVLARRAGRLEEAENLFRRAIKVSSGRLKAKALHQLGVVLGERSRWSDAAESFRLAAQLRPQYFGHWLALGEALQEQGQPEEALTALEKARALRKSSADVELALARAYQERGAGAKAMRHVQRAVRLDPAGPQARAALADG
jgi:tetratricopeptide (TPR) repeat protein